MTAQSKQARGGWRTTIWGELSAEFLGTFVLIAFGLGVVAVAGLPGSERTSSATAGLVTSGDWLLINWGWALAVAFGVYVAGGVSGAHINPAVTLALAVKRDFPWSKVLPYIVAQTIGAFAAAALVYLNYHEAISAFEDAKGITRGAISGAANSTPTFGIFATFPAPYFGSSFGPLIDQIIGTAFLVMFIFALLDRRNQPPESNLAPLLIGLVVAVIGMSFGTNAGYAINPARDFGPRVFAWLAGWGDVAFPGQFDYWWVPIVGPLIGGVLGALAYDFFIRDVLAAREEPEADVVSRGQTVEDDRETDVEVQARTVRDE